MRSRNIDVLLLVLALARKAGCEGWGAQALGCRILAARLGVSRRTVEHWVQGARRPGSAARAMMRRIEARL